VVKITFIDDNYVEYPRGATGSMVAFGDPDTVYEIIDAWLDSTMGEGKHMNWLTAKASLSKMLDAAKILVTEDVDRHVGPEFRVWLEFKRIDIIGRAEPQSHVVTLEPIDQIKQDREYTRFTELAEPSTSRMVRVNKYVETEPIHVTTLPTSRVNFTEEMAISDAIRSEQQKEEDNGEFIRIR